MKAYGVVLLVVASLGFSACSDAGPGPDNSAREAGVLPPVFPPVLLPHILSYEEVVQACEDAASSLPITPRPVVHRSGAPGEPGSLLVPRPSAKFRPGTP